MYAKLMTFATRQPEDPTREPRLTRTRKLEGEVTEVIILEFIRQVFADELVHAVGPGGSKLRETERIVIDFVGRYS